MIKGLFRYMTISNRKKLKTVRYILLNYLRREHVYPFYASFKISHRCNLRCSFCNLWNHEILDLRTEKILTVLDNLENSSVFVVDLEGGEPFLRKDLLEILRYARAKDLVIGVTTNGTLLDRHSAEIYRPYLDFFNISVDEGHKNLYLFDVLDFKQWSPLVTVHVVVTKHNIGTLEEKIDRIGRLGLKAVVMVASPLAGACDMLPDMEKLETVIRAIRKKYINVMVPTDGLFRVPKEGSGCSSASIVIDSDGGLYYPCRVLERKPVNLAKTPLMDFLVSEDAKRARKELRRCQRRCYWYQNFTCADYINPFRFYTSIKPYISPSRILE